MASQQLAIPPGYASAVFPAAGVALAVILHSGYRLLPGVWAGSFCLNLWIASNSAGINDKTILIATLVASGAALQTGVAALLIRRGLKSSCYNLDSDTDIIRFLLIAGPLSCLISSSWATVTLTLSGVISTNAWLFNWSNWWVGDSVGAMLFAPMTLMLLQRRGATEKSRIANVTLPTLLITAGIVVLFVYVSGIEALKVRQDIAEHGHAISDQLKNRIISYHEVVASLDNYLEATPDINRFKFERYTQNFFQDHPDLIALSWNPQILQKSRQPFEQSLSKEYGQHHLSITERNLHNQLVPARLRDQYVAIAYISPLQNNRKALGFDILSNPLRKEAIERAIKSGQMTATAPIKLIQDATTNTGVLLLHPVYLNNRPASDHKKTAPQGFAVGVFHMDKMLSELAAKSMPAELALSLYDAAAPLENQTLYRLNLNRPLLTEYSWESDIAIGGRAWHITLSPTRAYLEENRSFLPWGVLATGLTLVSLLQAFLLAITGRTSIVQRTVDEQTQTLLESEQRLRKQNEKNLAILHNASDGIHILDTHGDLIEASDSFFTMLGYQREEMINMHVSQWDALLTPQELSHTINLQFEQKQRAQFQTVHRRKDGSTFDVEISSCPLELDGQTVLFNSSRDISARRCTEASLQQQLRFTRAINQISRTFVEQEENALLLTNTVINIGTVLGADRALIYDINFATEQIIGLSEYLNPERADITATLATYPLKLFFGGASEMMSTHGWLTSQRDDVEPHLAQDGSSDILHRQMNIQSLLWYPFAFHGNGFHLLALNHIHAKKIWSLEEIEFIESVSHLVSFELEKIHLTNARKRADAERDRMLKIIEDAPDFIATCDMQTHLKYLNASGAKLVGLPEKAELSTLKICDMHPKLVAQKVLDEAIPIALEQGVWQGETTLLHRDGHETPVSQVLLVHRDAAGNPEYLSTIMRDISGMKKYERALLNNEQNLLNILKLSPIAVRIAINRGQKVAFCNPRYANLIKSEDPLGDNPKRYYANNNDYQTILDELANGNTVLNRMVELNIPGGATTWALASYMPMQYDGEDAILGWFYDISDRKQTETELLRSNIELEQFSYAISHDMRQPLRMISSYLQLLEMSLADRLDDENRDYIQYAVEGAKRIDQMLIALLEYSRVGRMSEDKAWHESHILLDEALLFLQPAINEAQAIITLSGDWPALFANGDEITRLLQNLIGNAIKYRITGRIPEINLNSAQFNHEWHLCISDNGIGIAPGQITRLFQVFQRLQSREVYQGTGIGLALCRKITEHHGGRIWVESSGEAMGSKFFVVLPVTDQ